MNEEKIYPVITFVDEASGDVEVNYGEECEKNECHFQFSSRTPKGKLMIPLWFKSDEAARDYIKKATAKGTERVFYLIQEFTYKDEAHQGEAKYVFSITSDTWPSLKEGKTERSPGVWANVRSIFICDKEAALNYAERFNADCAAAFKAGRGKKEGI